MSHDRAATLATSVETLASLAVGHKQNSGIAARDVLMFCVEPTWYPFDPGSLMSLDTEHANCAIDVMRYVLTTRHSIRAFLSDDVFAELHAEWTQSRRTIAA
ncbi:hypothetical protein [Ruegeria arenilitoris]|uniref:hypothetical protein n=1 Tax=Ruegeria arenilitoris TaxID=1173585 RepID=UPI00147D61EF|nr:hypothetical protein [Ruegeria arenilitoris]